MRISQSSLAWIAGLALMVAGCGPSERELAAERARLEAADELAALKAQMAANAAEKELAAESARVKAEKELADLKAQVAASAAKELSAAKARLELARSKTDLDEMFLALSQLESLGEKLEGDDLAKVRSGISLLQNSRVAKAEHRHEDVVNHAGALVDLFPEHTEARRDLKESGLIFHYLQSALDHLNGCFATDENERLSFARTRQVSSQEASQEVDTKLDFEVISSNLNQATLAADEAIKLDPQYEAALRLRKSVQQAKSTLAYVVSEDIFQDVDQLRFQLVKVHSKVYNEMAIESYQGQSLLKWALSIPVRAEVKSLVDKHLKSLNERAAFLTQLDAKDVEPMTRTAVEVTALLPRLRNAVVDARGSVSDYKNDFLKVDEEFAKTVHAWQAAGVNAAKLASDIVGFAETITAIQLFKLPTTKEVLEKHKNLINGV